MGERTTDTKRLRQVRSDVPPIMPIVPPDWIIEEQRRRDDARRRDDRPALRIEPPPRVVTNAPSNGDGHETPAPATGVVVFDISTGLSI